MSQNEFKIIFTEALLLINRKEATDDDNDEFRPTKLQKVEEKHVII